MTPLQAFAKSVGHALRGIETVLRGERNFRLQLIAFVFVIVFAEWLHIRPWEWAVLVIVSGSVLVLECCNSAMERLIDLLKPRLHGYVKEVK
ncbi:MAG: diacylglycerol kinase, partial [Candidatus Uhrbacteria bacterium]